MVYVFDYLFLGFFLTFIYFELNKKEVKKMSIDEATGKFFIVWLIYPIVLLADFVKFLINYFIINEK